MNVLEVVMRRWDTGAGDGRALIRRDWDHVVEEGSMLVAWARESVGEGWPGASMPMDPDAVLAAANAFEDCIEDGPELIDVEEAFLAYGVMLEAALDVSCGSGDHDRVRDDWRNVVMDELQLAARGYFSLPGESQERLAFMEGGRFETRYYHQPGSVRDTVDATPIIGLVNRAAALPDLGDWTWPECAPGVVTAMRDRIGVLSTRPSGADRRNARAEIEERYEAQADGLALTLMSIQYERLPVQARPRWYRTNACRRNWCEVTIGPASMAPTASLLLLGQSPSTQRHEKQSDNIDEQVATNARPWSRIKYSLIENNAAYTAWARRYPEPESSRAARNADAELCDADTNGILWKSIAVMRHDDPDDELHGLPIELALEDVLDEHDPEWIRRLAHHCGIHHPQAITNE
ncbi:hypothetical protein EMO89_00410 [Bifidobacterium tissieri]|uniref:Uncharacterized protein n=1 Tax=Bifidobacterium tissieri TaxID=1630162 RepID=A0A5M9ZWW5_9BIFI|nr:hypothetical protein [Bifidobacterium tissieri]KAA8832025.1 hypothetical protein EMO89_00410 [Bifidobacterium tissieri]